MQYIIQIKSFDSVKKYVCDLIWIGFENSWFFAVFGFFNRFAVFFIDLDLTTLIRISSL
jgi:hypothetical protein